MTYKLLSPSEATSVGKVETDGSFTLAGTDSPTAASGTGWTVARTSEGVTTVTLQDTRPAHTSVLISVENPSRVPLQAFVGAVDMAAGTFTVLTCSGSGNDLHDYSDDIRIHFQLSTKKFKTV